MNKSYWKILIPLLLAAAIAFGFYQRQQDPYTENDYRPRVEDKAVQDELRGFYSKGQQLAPQDQSKKSVTFLAVGDVMLSRNVAGTSLRANDPMLPFRKMEHIFNSVDFTFANLESPFSSKDTFNPSGSLVFNAPRSMVQGLVEYKFKALTLANNHALDQGKAGVDYTLELLDEKGIRHAGMGKTLAEAWQPAIVDQNGITICFIGASYSSINDNGATRNDYVARIDDLENLKSSILNLKSSCDFVVASMHAGTEYVTKPNQQQVDFARTAIDYGADMVIGHHPHWVQTIEKYCPLQHSPPKLGGVDAEGGRGGMKVGEIPPPPASQGTPPNLGESCANPKYIFYSLGNFIFDQEWSRETKEGLALKIHLSKIQVSNLQGPKVPAKLEHVELMPVIIENYSTPSRQLQKNQKGYWTALDNRKQYWNKKQFGKSTPDDA